MARTSTIWATCVAVHGLFACGDAANSQPAAVHQAAPTTVARQRPSHPDDLFVYEWRERFDAASANGTLTASLAEWEAQFPSLRSSETTDAPAAPKYGTVRGRVSARAPSAYFLTAEPRGPATQVLCGDREDIERRCNALAIGDEVAVAASVVGDPAGRQPVVLSVRTFVERRGEPDTSVSPVAQRSCGPDPSSLMGGAPRAVESWLRSNGVDPSSGSLRCGRASLGASCWELTCELPATGAWYSFKIASGAVTTATRTR